MDSENPSGADNQQETADLDVLDPNWVVGFVDGEGCFCVSIHRSSVMAIHGGWQLQPAFDVYQHKDHEPVLQSLERFFGCGRIRSKGPNSDVLSLGIEGLRELERAVLPFFEEHRLRVKASDFRIFADIVRGMRSKEHLTRPGFEPLVRFAYGMNARGKEGSRGIEEVWRDPQRLDVGLHCSS